MCSVFILCFLCSCYRCKNEGLFSGCFLTYTILNSWCKALNKAIKKIPSVWKIPLCISPERWCNAPLNVSLTCLRLPCSTTKGNSLKLPLCYRQSRNGWITLCFQKGCFFLESSEISSSVRTAFSLLRTVTDVHRPHSSSLHETDACGSQSDFLLNSWSIY